MLFVKFVSFILYLFFLNIYSTLLGLQGCSIFGFLCAPKSFKGLREICEAFGQTHAARRVFVLRRRKEGAGSRAQLKQHPTKKSSPPSEASSLPVFSLHPPSSFSSLHIEKPNHSHYTRRPSASTELPVTVRVCAVNSSLERANELF